MVCSYGCKSTKDDPEARPNGDGTMFNVSYDIKDTDPNANGVCFTDDIYAPNATPGPSPKPDDPGNNNSTKPGGDTPKPDKPDKPDTNNTKPDKPNQGGGGHPGGGSNPGNNNGTKPGNDNGTKPGKDDNQGKFDPKDFDDGGLDKARDGLYDSIKNHLENGISKFDGVRDGIDQFISNVKGKGFAKVKSDIKRSCPIKKEIQLPDGKARELVVDYCDAVAPASEVSYYVFDYDPKDEILVREYIDKLVKKDKEFGDGYKLKVYDVYDLMIDLLESEGYLEDCFEMEKNDGMNYLVESVNDLLRMNDDNHYFAEYIEKNTPEKAIVFLIGVGKIFPFVRSHKILNNLHQIFDRLFKQI